MAAASNRGSPSITAAGTLPIGLTFFSSSLWRSSRPSMDSNSSPSSSSVQRTCLERLGPYSYKVISGFIGVFHLQSDHNYIMHHHRTQLKLPCRSDVLVAITPTAHRPTILAYIYFT